MKKFKKALAAFTAAVTSFAFVVPLAACGENNDGGNDDETQKEGANSIIVTSLGGMELEGVTVELYRNGNRVYAANTDEDGKVSFDLADGDYSVEFKNLPKGYFPDSQGYTVKSTSKTTYLGVPSAIITDEEGPDGTYKTGDILYDETFIDLNHENNEIKLSDYLDPDGLGKEMIFINFWNTGCGNCLLEMPHIETAYQTLQDQIAVLGVDVQTFGASVDTPASSLTTAESNDLTYDMVYDEGNVYAGKFKVGSALPISIIVDRYGMVCEVIRGALSSADEFIATFMPYLGDDYTQNVNKGSDANTDEDFVPDLPADFDATMPPSADISDAINNTGKNVLFSTDTAESAWPWTLDGDAIVPTNPGHRGTVAIIYAQVDLEEGDVFAFDYQMFMGASTRNSFYVVVDGRNGNGTQILNESGNSSKITSYAYVALEAGRHEIAFVYSRQDATTNATDGVAVSNIRITTADEITEPLDIPYFAARDLQRDGTYGIYENVYKDDEGYYHVGDESNKKADDPYLFVDLTHPVPFFLGNSTSSSVYSRYVSTDDMEFNGTDYSNLLDSYISYAANSTLRSLVPARDDIKLALNDLYEQETGEYSANGWLEFCVFYKHYGSGESVGNPILGLTYFSAFDAVETTGLSDSSSELNSITFDRIVMPRGLLFKFTAESDGVYVFKSLGNSYTDAWMFDGSLNVAPVYGRTIASSSDRYTRYAVDENNFQIAHYMHSGESVYLSVAYASVDEMGTFKFRIDNVGDSFEYLEMCASNFLIVDPDDPNHYITPVNCNVQYNSATDVYYDAATGDPIYCDFTRETFLFSTPVAKMLKNFMNEDGTFNAESDTTKSVFNFDGFSFTRNDGTEIVGKDYTEIMVNYYAESIEGKVDGSDYHGLLAVNQELSEILQLINAKYGDRVNDSEWLKGCWHTVRVSADN